MMQRSLTCLYLALFTLFACGCAKSRMSDKGGGQVLKYVGTDYEFEHPKRWKMEASNNEKLKFHTLDIDPSDDSFILVNTYFNPMDVDETLKTFV
jgi:hypothetical protein